MSIAKIVWAVSAVAAVILSFVSGFDHGDLILVILGLVSGWFLDSNHRRGVIIAAIFLSLPTTYGVMEAIPAVGKHVVYALGSLGTVFAAASVMAIVRTLVERILMSNTDASTS